MQKRLLIIDDEESLREGLTTYLQFEGYATDSVNSAEEALKLDLKLYDLILLDIMMDKMSGTDFAILLKSNAETKNIPIIFITAKSEDDEMVKGLRIGADDYIIKPFYMKNVLARIEAVLRRYENVYEPKSNAMGIECDRKNLFAVSMAKK